MSLTLPLRLPRSVVRQTLEAQLVSSNPLLLLLTS